MLRFHHEARRNTKLYSGRAVRFWTAPHAHLAAMAVGCGGVMTLITQLFADGVLRKVISSGEVNKHTVSVAVKSLPGV